MENIPLDIVVALGQNWNRPLLTQLRRHYSHESLELSAASKLDAVAAAELYVAGQTREILFSSGYTAGEHQPSEAQAMKAYVMRLFPDIPESALLTEDISIDTAQNAQEVRRILDQRGEKRVGLLTIGRHMRRAKRHFALAGVAVAKTLVADNLPIDDPLYQSHVRAYRRSSQYTTRAVTEPIANLTVAAEELLQLKPGSILGTITKHTRR